MTMDLWVVAGVIVAAVAYLAWTVWRTVAGTRKGCGTGCGKCSTAPEPVQAGRRSLPMAG